MFDTYKEISINDSDRSVRGEAPGHRLQSMDIGYRVWT